MLSIPVSALAADLDARTLAIPAISTGGYGYPPESAAPIAVSTLRDGAADSPLSIVTLVAFDAATLSLFEEALSDR